MSTPHNTQGEPFAGGYSDRQRVVEGALLLASATYWSWLVYSLARTIPAGRWYFAPMGLVFGMLCADLLSGLVHWGCDTWGSIDTPFLGRTVIRTFREHHIDQKAITRHDLIETNGSTAVAGAIPALCALLVPFRTAPWAWALAAVGASATLFVTFTSQIHKWAHEDKPPRFIALLQRTGFLLSPEHHSVHHTAPYVEHYCITAGWLNRPLAAVGFFRRLERVIERVTGTPPRFDPAAENLARATGVAAEGFFAQGDVAPTAAVDVDDVAVSAAAER